MLRLDWKLPNNDSISMFEVIANWLESDAGPLYQELAIKKAGATKSFVKLIKNVMPKFFPFHLFSSEQSYERIQNCVLSHIHKLDSIPLQKCEMQLQRNILSALENFDSRCEYLASLLRLVKT